MTANATPRRVFSAELNGHEVRGKPVFGPGAVRGSAAMSGESTVAMLAALASFRLELLTHLGFAPEPEAVKAPAPEPNPGADERDHLKSELDLVKNEIRALSYTIQQTKAEVAALHQPQESEGRIKIVQHELDSVVAATEDATGRILAEVETIDLLARNTLSATKDKYVRQQSEEISEAVTRIFEACNFQDVTGQRLTKVVNTLKFIEERILKIIDIWGEDSFDGFTPPEEPRGLDNLDRTLVTATDQAERVSQDEVDKLFG